MRKHKRLGVLLAKLRPAEIKVPRWAEAALLAAALLFGALPALDAVQGEWAVFFAGTAFACLLAALFVARARPRRR